MTRTAHRHAAAMLTLAWTLSACHTLPPKQPDQAPGSNPVDIPHTEPAQVPPCLSAGDSPKPAPKRKPKPVVHAAEPPAPAAEPPPAAEPAPAAEPPPAQVAAAGVKRVSAAESSILGRKVRGSQGEDLGRVVDVLADAEGRVRIAIIEFGGFLGVGNRRIAVDWSLLKFQTHDPDAPVVLDVALQKLQGTPEYKGSERPLALMAPEPSAALRPNTHD